MSKNEIIYLTSPTKIAIIEIKIDDYPLTITVIISNCYASEYEMKLDCNYTFRW